MEDLAINGGKPSFSPALPYRGHMKRTIDEEEKNAVADVLDRGTASRWAVKNLEDSYIVKFEADLLAMTGAKYCTTVSSGTAALHVSLVSLDIGPTDEVIIPSFSWPSCANSVASVGAVPVPCDVDESMCIDPKKLDKLITKKTKAVIFLQYFGRPADMESLLNIAKKHNVFLIEDFAQGPGSYKGKPFGSFGDVAIASFNPQKMTTAGEGGAVFFNGPHAEKSHARAANYVGIYNMMWTKYPHLAEVEIFPFMNLKLSEVSASIGWANLKKLFPVLVDPIRKNRVKLIKYITYTEGPWHYVPSHDPEGDTGYDLGLIFDTFEHAKFFFKAIQAEGIPGVRWYNEFVQHGAYSSGFVELLKEQNQSMEYFSQFTYTSKFPLFAHKRGITTGLNPWKLAGVEPPEGDPVAFSKELMSRIVSVVVHPDLTEEQLKGIGAAVDKVSRAIQGGIKKAQ